MEARSGARKRAAGGRRGQSGVAGRKGYLWASLSSTDGGCIVICGAPDCERGLREPTRTEGSKRSEGGERARRGARGGGRARTAPATRGLANAQWFTGSGRGWCAPGRSGGADSRSGDIAHRGDRSLRVETVDPSTGSEEVEEADRVASGPQYPICGRISRLHAPPAEVAAARAPIDPNVVGETWPRESRERAAREPGRGGGRAGRLRAGGGGRIAAGRATGRRLIGTVGWPSFLREASRALTT
jgi:hypothetical protein